MAAIPEQLADRARDAGAEIRTGVEVTDVTDPASTGGRGIEITDGGESERLDDLPADAADAGERGDDSTASVTVETSEGTVEADAVVVAGDPKTARELTGVSSVPTEGVPSVTQYYSVPAGTDLGTDRKLLLNAKDASPNAVVPMSEVAPEYAPAGRELLCATFLGEESLDASDEELATATRRALSAWYPERDFEDVEVVATDRIEFAQFAQPPAVHDDLPSARTAGGHTYLAGDYTGWSSINAAMKSGRLAAGAVLADR
jgi:phytoene dehydrogenase-like protein